MNRRLGFLADWRALESRQRHAFIASFLGWTLDAFDFFLLIFVIHAIAGEFRTDVEAVSLAVTLTLAMRPLGALVFGLLADRFGRRPILMADILLFSVLELASAFAPSLPVLLALRAAFGFAMGGEWGIGASLALESIPPRMRGLASGILQEGYVAGYFLAAVVYGSLFTLIGWRGMFVVGLVPALLVLYIRRLVEESPAWERVQRRGRRSLRASLRGHWSLFGYVVILMTAFNFFSHGTQDLYPTFLQVQHGLAPATVSLIAIVGNIGAFAGGILFGALSEHIGRRQAIIAASLVGLVVAPLWAFAPGPLLLGAGAFLMQVSVQGAWGVVPAHLNELSPDEIRGTFPGFAYQLGNLFASANATIQAHVARVRGGDYSFALVVVAAIMAIAISALAALGPEARGVEFGAEGEALPE